MSRAQFDAEPSAQISIDDARALISGSRRGGEAAGYYARREIFRPRLRIFRRLGRALRLALGRPGSCALAFLGLALALPAGGAPELLCLVAGAVFFSTWLEARRSRPWRRGRRAWWGRG